MSTRYVTHRDALSPDPPFSADGLREIFATQITNRRKNGRPMYVMPPDDALAILAAVLNRWHAHFYRLQAQRQANDDARRAEAAIAELREVLPRIEASCRPVPGRDDTFGLWRHRAAARLLEAVQRDASRIVWQQRVVVRSNGRDDNPASWQSLADVLPVDFAEAWQTVNPPAGASESGPLVTFLSVIIPALNGEQPSPASIRRRLVERRGRASEA
ncbi:hypothetical protein [Acidisphaera rubrifaciens]|uniref:Uncharacterized protein n=1 Tax=Acidisphaera rubrifaciens HS-AP3 TaxID=1231350 RepID=A0A0D6P7E5_9PROT|nr:hypothetical protein [Acidisphaera rubrifaciens]GAN77675.1 hypothetical protein Asru_0414_02 [Acidisphaera rubrifaciens HS-AP3]